MMLIVMLHKRHGLTIVICSPGPTCQMYVTLLAPNSGQRGIQLLFNRGVTSAIRCRTINVLVHQAEQARLR